MIGRSCPPCMEQEQPLTWGCGGPSRVPPLGPFISWDFSWWPYLSVHFGPRTLFMIFAHKTASTQKALWSKHSVLLLHVWSMWFPRKASVMLQLSREKGKLVEASDTGSLNGCRESWHGVCISAPFQGYFLHIAWFLLLKWESSSRADKWQL